MIHDIDVTYYFCGEERCAYKAKFEGSVKSHKSFVHGIDVIHYLCLEMRCNYEGKSGSQLKAHIASKHGRVF